MASLTLARSSELSLCRSHVNGLSHTQSVCGEGLHHLKFTVLFAPRRTSIRAQPRMGNVNEGKGVFAPLVVVARNVIGKQRFNQLRGKAIALHSQVITEFCKSIGADAKQRQGLIRLAKKNGEKLGFLA